jgi:SAM-dependent methyltransferase
MSRPQWAPDDIDVSRPNAARIYDYFLGGSHNFTIDRQLGDQVRGVMPDVPTQAMANRQFMRRAVTYCVQTGIRQFLDIGSGIPTSGNVHEVTGRLAPDSRVVYVDMDPVAVAHSLAILEGNDRATAIHEDLRRPDQILDHPDLRAMIDLSQPVAVVLVAVLHAVPEEDQPAKVLARLREAMAPGSHLVIAHGTDEGDPERAHHLQAMSARTNTPLCLRSRDGVAALFDGFKIVEPGVVWVSQWRPDPQDPADPQPELSNNYGAVGRRP